MIKLDLKKTLLVGSAALALLLTGCAEKQATEKDIASEKQDDTSAPMKETEQPKESKMTEATDPYLWLEEVEGEKALETVSAWNKRTLKVFEADPLYEEFLAEAKTILNSDERIANPGLRGNDVYNFWQDEDNTRGLWRKMSKADYIAGKEKWDVIVDFDKLAEDENENWVYKGVDCLEPDYTRCMLTLSRGGSDASVRREFDIPSKSFVEGGFELAEAKASTAWLSQDTMLVGTDVGEGSKTDSGYPRKTQLWKRGQKIEDAEVIFEGQQTDVGVWPFSSISQGKIYAGVVRAVTFYESEYYMMQEDGKLKQLSLPALVDFNGISAGKLIISLNQDWEEYKIGSVIAMDPETEATELLFLPTARQAVNGVSTAENVIYLNVLDNIQGKILKMTAGDDGWSTTKIDLPDAGVVSIGGMDGKTGDMFVYFENPSTPETLYFVAGDSIQPQALDSTPAFFKADGVVTRQFEAVSKDGTKVPYFVTAKDEVLKAGPAPTIQYGYGGFQISLTANYSGTTGKLWLENDGVYVIANIRGGGEFGPKWHQSALKENRQRAYDDFYAVSEDLIARGITTPDQLGILGGSNGGLLMGVAMTQRPDLYNAIGIGVPLLDMLRYHKLLAGASWVGEYGDPDKPEDRPHLEALSPYHNLKKEGDYPEVYFFTSTKDDRVHPGHARKMAMKMEEYGQSFYYYENMEGGHSASANQDQLAKRLALQYVYFSQKLRDKE